jgi:hypothetical protein
MAAKPSHVGVDADRLAYHLHCPTASGCQTRAHGPLTDATLLYLVIKLLLRVSLPEQARTLHFLDKGVESLVRHHLVQSSRVGRCGI